MNELTLVINDNFGDNYIFVTVFDNDHNQITVDTTEARNFINSSTEVQRSGFVIGGILWVPDKCVYRVVYDRIAN